MRPYRPVRPGELLQEELEAREWTQADLAAIINRPVQAVNEIVAGKKAITPETALALASALDTSPEYWLNLESAYRLDLLHQRSLTMTDISRRSHLYSHVPVQELVKRHWIDVPDPLDTNRLEAQVCGFLEISAPDQTPELLNFAARRTNESQPVTAGQIAWIYRVKQIARLLHAPEFNKRGFAQLCAVLPKCSTSDEETKRIPEKLLEVGVIFVLVDVLPRTQLDGATFWLGGNPVIALSFRYDRIDWFWFTLMHELAHLLFGHGRDSLVFENALVGKDATPTQDKPAEEQAADRQAGDWLIPDAALRGFIRQTHPFYWRKAIIQFASAMKVDPGIVVGRLQYLDEVEYSHHRNLLRPIKQLFMDWQIKQAKLVGSF